MNLINRRQFIQQTAISVGALSIIAGCGDDDDKPAGSSAEIFSLGIASGDPTTTGAVLWTRIEPSVHKKYNYMPILYVSEDPNFPPSKTEISMIIPLDSILPENDYTIKIDLNGRLRPGKTYYYKFRYGGVDSPVGRFKTLPETGIREVKIAFVVCQDYTNGYYSAYRHISQDDSIYFVIHLGDFIYEQNYGGKIRTISLPSGSNFVMNLEDYRYLYRTYLSDQNLQAARAKHPFVHTWDDHEFINDYYYDYNNSFWNSPDHPYKDDKQKLLQLKRDSIRAFLDYIPVRPSSVRLNSQNPLEWITLYRDFRMGNFAHFILTDERSYRTAQPCGVTTQQKYGHPGCPTQQTSTMLGQSQLNWLLQKLSSKDAGWKVWANEVMFAQLKANLPAASVFVNLDAWDGYLAERNTILGVLSQNSVNNLVVLTGDMHASLVSEIRTDFSSNNYRVLGAEFMTPAISSESFGEALMKMNNMTPQQAEMIARMSNPWIKFIDMSNHGYAVITLTERHAEYELFFVDKNNQNSGKNLASKFRYNKDVGVLEKLI